MPSNPTHNSARRDSLLNQHLLESSHILHIELCKTKETKENKTTKQAQPHNMNRSDSASTCVDYDNVEWWDTWNVVSMVALLTLDLMVIVGNILVIAAVYSSPKLRSVTNFFIVSLAVADLLVGVAVLPFSATWEVFKVSVTVWAVLLAECFA